MSDTDLPRSKAVMRGKMLVAWCADASPPVLWRFVASNVSGGFGLRSVDGRTELVSFDGGARPQVIASFTSEASAERALARMSHALLVYKAPWKKVMNVLGAIVILILLIISLEIFQNLQTLKALSGLRSLTGQSLPARTAATPPSLLLPGMAPPGSAAAKPSGPPMGQPTDVDKFYK